MNTQVRIASVQSMPKQRRRTRRPRHSFNLKAKPYEIVPFFIAPVLPGETLDSLMFQATAVSDPVHNALIGCHKEYYLFYVKHRGLSADDTTGLLQSMMLDTTTNVSSLQAAANSLPFYTFKTGMKFVEMCHKAVVTSYFRDENEAYNAATIENYVAAQIDQENWTHSLKLESTTGDDAELPGVDELEELDILPGMTTQYAQWEMMRDYGMTDLSYEDFLRSYGVSVPEKDVDKDRDGNGIIDKHEPELVRFFRKWAKPSNVINPADGVPSSAWYWDMAESANKRRFFKEPGFLYGVTVTRPKIYLGSQKGAAVGLLNDAWAWLPAVVDGLGYTSVKEVLDSTTDGILQNQTEDYWLDIKDLFEHGDQFVNFAMSAAANHGLALPTATLDKKYPTAAMVNSLFKTAGSEYVREDGVVMLNINTRMSADSTPRGV